MFFAMLFSGWLFIIIVATAALCLSLCMPLEDIIEHCNSVVVRFMLTVGFLCLGYVISALLYGEADFNTITRFNVTI